MSLRGEMVRYANEHPGSNEDALAEGFLKVHTKRALAPLLAEEFLHLRRHNVRAIEGLAVARAASLPQSPVTAEMVRGRLGELGILLDQPYRVGDGAERAGRDMTIEDWGVRKAMLTSQAQGIERAISVCDRAIDAIRRAGVRTLGEIDQLDVLDEAA